MFADARSARCEPSSYAKSVIAKVRAFDRGAVEQVRALQRAHGRWPMTEVAGVIGPDGVLKIETCRRSVAL